MTELGLKVWKIEKTSVWSKFLKPDDTVLSTSTLNFKGAMRQTAHHRLIETLGKSGMLRVLRGGVTIEITLKD